MTYSHWMAFDGLDGQTPVLITPIVTKRAGSPRKEWHRPRPKSRKNGILAAFGKLCEKLESQLAAQPAQEGY
jgi:hypothetical protein